MQPSEATIIRDTQMSLAVAEAEESPFAYKAIGPVIATLRQAEVAELYPVLTMKG